MPASEVMEDFKAGTLHSGKGGKIVTNPHQAKAIQLSYLRKEGHNIPMKGKKKPAKKKPRHPEDENPHNSIRM